MHLKPASLCCFATCSAPAALSVSGEIADGGVCFVIHMHCKTNYPGITQEHPGLIEAIKVIMVILIKKILISNHNLKILSFRGALGCQSGV
jgi:hypothetical protein